MLPSLVLSFAASLGKMYAWGEGGRLYERRFRAANSTCPNAPRDAAAETLFREKMIPRTVSISSSSSDDEPSDSCSSEVFANAEAAIAEAESGPEGNDAKVEAAVAADEKHGDEELGASGADADVEAAKKKAALLEAHNRKYETMKQKLLVHWEEKTSAAASKEVVGAAASKEVGGVWGKGGGR